MSLWEEGNREILTVREARRITPRALFRMSTSRSDADKSSVLAGEKVRYGLLYGRSGSLSSCVVFTGLPLTYTDNSCLSDDMVRVHTHTVECPLDNVLDLMYVGLGLGSITASYSDYIAFQLCLHLKLLLQQLRKELAVAPKLFHIYCYHQLTLKRILQHQVLVGAVQSFYVECRFSGFGYSRGFSETASGQIQQLDCRG